MNIENDIVPPVDVDEFKLAWKMQLELEQRVWRQTRSCNGSRRPSAQPVQA